MARNGMTARFAATGFILAAAVLGAGCDRVWTAYAAMKLGEPLPPRGTRALELATRTRHGVTDLVELSHEVLSHASEEWRSMAAVCNSKGVVSARCYQNKDWAKTLIPFIWTWVGAQQDWTCLEVQVPEAWRRENTLNPEQLAAVYGALSLGKVGPPDQTDLERASPAPGGTKAPDAGTGGAEYDDSLEAMADRLLSYLGSRDVAKGTGPREFKNIVVYLMLVLYWLPREPSDTDEPRGQDKMGECLKYEGGKFGGITRHGARRSVRYGEDSYTIKNLGKGRYRFEKRSSLPRVSAKFFSIPT